MLTTLVDFTAAAYCFMGTYAVVFMELRKILGTVLVFTFAYFDAKSESLGIWICSEDPQGNCQYVLGMGTISRTADFDIMYMARYELCEAFCTAITVSLKVPTLSLRGACGGGGRHR